MSLITYSWAPVTVMGMTTIFIPILFWIYTTGNSSKYFVWNTKMIHRTEYFNENDYQDRAFIFGHEKTYKRMAYCIMTRYFDFVL